MRGDDPRDLIGTDGELIEPLPVRRRGLHWAWFILVIILALVMMRVFFLPQKHNTSLPQTVVWPTLEPEPTITLRPTQIPLLDSATIVRPLDVQNADQIERVGNLGDPVDALFFEATSDEQRFFLVRDGVLSNQRFYSGRLIDIRFMRTARSPVAFSIDQNVIASGSAGQDILFWSSNLGQSEVVIPMEGDLTALTFNANGMLLAAGDENGDILIWNVFTREERARLHMGGAVRALIFEQHSDSLIVASMGNPIRIYEGEEIKVEIPVVGLVNNLAISPDGHFLAYNDDERVYLYDLEAGREYDHLETHEEAVNAVAFSADGLLLAAGDSGGSIAIIDAANMTLLQTLSVTPRHAVRQVDFNAFRGQSTVLAVVDDTGNASFWGIVEATE